MRVFNRRLTTEIKRQFKEESLIQTGMLIGAIAFVAVLLNESGNRISAWFFGLPWMWIGIAALIIGIAIVLWKNREKKWHEKIRWGWVVTAVVCIGLVSYVRHTITENEKKNAADATAQAAARAEYFKAHPDERLQYVAETTFTRLATANGQGKLHLPRGRRWDAGPDRIGGYRVRYPTEHGDTIVEFSAIAPRKDLPYPLPWVEFLALEDTITMVVRIH